MNHPFTTSEIVTSDGGINWSWYTAYAVNPDGTLSVVASDRFHRFDYSQGAADHPTPTHSVSHVMRRCVAYDSTPPEWITGAQARLDAACVNLGITDSAPIDCVIHLHTTDGTAQYFAVRRA
jgi:hypothetical protein